MNLSNACFLFGLIIDILGAYFLAQGFISKNLEDLTFEGTSGYGHAPNLRYITSNLYQKAEARIGFLLLALGFFLQSFDYLFLSSSQPITISKPSVYISLLLIVLVVSIIAKFVRRLLFSSYAMKVAAIIFQLENFQEDSWIITVAGYLLPLLKRQPNETDTSFAIRVRSVVNAAK
jgi:hypothetical protein